MNKYAYKIVEIGRKKDVELEAELDALGMEGWEVVGVNLTRIILRKQLRP